MTYQDDTLNQSLMNLGITSPDQNTPRPKRPGLLKAMFTGQLDDKHRVTLSRIGAGLGNDTALKAWQQKGRDQQAQFQENLRMEQEAQQQKLDNDFRERQLIAEQKQTAAGSRGRSQFKDPFVGEDNELYYPIGNTGTGDLSYERASDGKIFPNMPSGVTGGFKGNESIRVAGGKDSQEAITLDTLAYEAIPDNMAQYQTMLSLADQSTSTAHGQFARFLAEKSGFDVSGYSASKTGEARALQNQMMLKAAVEFLKGQGQVTEGERGIVRDAIANIDQDPATWKAMVNMMIRRQDKLMAKVDTWDDLTNEERQERYQGDYRKFSRLYTRNNMDAITSKAVDALDLNGVTSSGIGFKVLE